MKSFLCNIFVFATALTIIITLKINHKYSYPLGSNALVGTPQPCYDMPILQPPKIITCPMPRIYSNQRSTCQCPYPRVSFDPISNSCNCPQYLPLWNGRNCVKCPQNLYFDKKQLQCYFCPQGFIHTNIEGNHDCFPSS